MFSQKYKCEKREMNNRAWQKAWNILFIYVMSLHSNFIWHSRSYFSFFFFSGLKSYGSMDSSNLIPYWLLKNSQTYRKSCGTRNSIWGQIYMRFYWKMIWMCSFSTSRRCWVELGITPLLSDYCSSQFDHSPVNDLCHK